MTTATKIHALPFYSEWSGHPLSSLQDVVSITRSTRPSKPIVWLAGDSSLDNKAWIPSPGPGGEPLPVDVPAVYSSLLASGKPKPDVAFWLNHFLDDVATAINAAVEASLLRDRGDGKAHDDFIREHIKPEDILIVSVGANDIALSPTASTARHLAQLTWFTPLGSIQKGTASSLNYFRHLFGAQTQSYIETLVAKTKPRAVIICMIYHPLEADAGAQPGWAESQLKLLGYNRNPGQLQAAIRKIYEQATCKIGIDGTKVLPCALYEAMDGKVKEDYVARVEPSVGGGRKMAELLCGKVREVLAD
ncbi:Esterase, SGNH hydrolase-type, subgroup [Teratosphaeria destructans]|uniref:Esterase, SGNH hydrolase-type, subgroup n=1 Tax=Teratosphaeria destructans TaxID=418781 RepID=A0A9W7W0S8_9PEZI|nr:Esterase, SGNH hydrolase-type, subgroup [Teratosphaeria destructans]